MCKKFGPATSFRTVQCTSVTVLLYHRGFTSVLMATFPILSQNSPATFWVFLCRENNLEVEDRDFFEQVLHWLGEVSSSHPVISAKF